MARRPFVGGNWKMNLNLEGASALAGAVAQESRDRSLSQRIDVAIFPAFVHLGAARGAIDAAQSDLVLGAQDLSAEKNGAFTGEISAEQLIDAGARAVLVGHSERRHVIGETDELIARKLRAALDAGLTAVLCVGETLEERDAGRTDEVNLRQLRCALEGLDSHTLRSVVIAYEPVWAIGTGRTASPEDAQNAHAAIREEVRAIFDHDASIRIRIIYGGSMKPENAADLLAQPDIDGGLIGGASLSASSFIAICQAASA